MDALLLAAAMVQPPHALPAAAHPPARPVRRPVTIAMLPTPFRRMLVPPQAGAAPADGEGTLLAPTAASGAADPPSAYDTAALPAPAPAVDRGLVRSAIGGLHALLGDANTAVALKARMMLSRSHAAHVELGTIYAPLPGGSYYDQAQQAIGDRRWLATGGW